MSTNLARLSGVIQTSTVQGLLVGVGDGGVWIGLPSVLSKAEPGISCLVGGVLSGWVEGLRYS